MKEKSQLEDMRAAVRGDLERARSRREGTLLQPEPEPEPEVAPEPAPPAVEEEPKRAFGFFFRRR